jgi:hypothetical protein
MQDKIYFTRFQHPSFQEISCCFFHTNQLSLSWSALRELEGLRRGWSVHSYLLLFSVFCPRSEEQTKMHTNGKCLTQEQKLWYKLESAKFTIIYPEY